MMFGENNLSLQYLDTFIFNFNALDSLRMVDSNAPTDIKVRDSENWSTSNQIVVKLLEDVNEITNDIQYDWTFYTEYSGTFQTNSIVEVTDEQINVELLKREKNILFYDEIILFEDELADNGMAQCKIRIRVMEKGFLALMRYFLRVDGVVFKILDTRIYYEFPKDYVIREIKMKEGPYSVIQEQIINHEQFGIISKEDIASEITPTTSVLLEKIWIK